jgi:hypothetical protein
MQTFPFNSEWTDLNSEVYQNLRTMEHRLNGAIATETNVDRLYWLRTARTQLRSANTFLMRANSALNSAAFHGTEEEVR